MKLLTLLIISSSLLHHFIPISPIISSRNVKQHNFSPHFDTFFINPEVPISRVFANYSGDLILGGLFPLHSYNLTAGTASHGGLGHCGPLNFYEGIQALEAAFYALDEINNSSMLRSRLGMLALDTCQDTEFAIYQTKDFIQVLVTNVIDMGELKCSDGSIPTAQGNLQELQKVIGVVGAEQSDVSIAIASFLKLFRVPQISHMSTSQDLSNKDKFPYFLRTVPTDRTTALGVIEMLRHMNWSFVHVVYDDTNYGSTLFSVFEDLISRFPTGYYNTPTSKNSSTEKSCVICMSSKTKIDSSTWHLSDYVGSLRRHLFSNDYLTSNVVVVFVSQKTLSMLLQGLSELRNSLDDQLTAAANQPVDVFSDDSDIEMIRSQVSKIDNLVWFGTDTWSGREATDYARFLNRTITIMPETLEVKGFTQHMRSLRPSWYKLNPWLAEYYESQCNCTYNLTRVTMETPSCYQIEGRCHKYIYSSYRQLKHLHFVRDVVYAYAHSIKKLEDELLRDRPRTDKLKPNQANGYTLLQTLKNITFNITSGRQFQFLNGNEGVPNYSIMYFDSDKQDWTEGGKYDGLADRNTGLSIGRILLDRLLNYTTSNCGSDCSTDEAKSYPTGSCCWVCTKCGRYDIVETVSNSVGYIRTQQTCKQCSKGFAPDSDRKQCVTLPLTYSGYSHPHIVPVVLISSLGVCITLIFTIIYAIYRDTPIIKASGRETSVVLMVGITLSYILPLIMMLPPHIVVCIVIRVSPGLCFTICYAAIFAKTNRIARIFQVLGSSSNSSNKRTKFTSPVSQMYIMGSMVAAEFIILLVGLLVEIPCTDIIADNSQRILICTKVNAVHLTTGLSFPVVLLILATMYGFRIRKVPDGFNESRMLAFVNYASCTTIIILFPVMFVLDKQVETGVVLCYGLQLSATAELLGLFLPKIYIALFRPEKNTKEAIMYRTRSQSSLSYINNLKFSQIETRNSISSTKGADSGEADKQSEYDFKVRVHQTDSLSSGEQQQQQLTQTSMTTSIMGRNAAGLHKNVSFSSCDHVATVQSVKTTFNNGSLSVTVQQPAECRRQQVMESDSGYSEQNTSTV